jgi:transaldolase / glucose-6-phosphate isomerase
MAKIEMSLGPYRVAVEDTLKKIANKKIIKRIWDMDHTVWKMDPEEITNRLGWLKSPMNMRQRVTELKTFTDEVRSERYTHALLLGMGGSSLAPDMLRRIFGVQDGFLDLAVLDSTDPAAVVALAETVNPEKRLFIVSTKSGTTTEVLSFFKYFYNKTIRSVGKDKAGEHFITITDPGNSFNDVAEKLRFRKVFAGDTTIGGRFSALSVFGLVPGSLLGMDTTLLLERAIASAEVCGQNDCSLSGHNDGCKMGAALGALAGAGRDKLTFFIAEKVKGFGDWVEQLIAESTGKEGKGILPVIGEQPDSPELYSNDRVFISMKLPGDDTFEPELGRLSDAGHPVIRVFLDDIYDLGGQFFLWEFATAVAGHVLGINPYDQPDVESAKVLSRKAMDEYLRKGRLSTQTPSLIDKDISVFSDLPSSDLSHVMEDFLSHRQEGSYISIQAYINPTPENERALQALRLSLLDKHRIPTTLGFGPRFLHSTGQLHKGDAGKGRFIQITCDDTFDLAIPNEAGSERSSMTFGILKAAQAMGDGEALRAAGRQIIRLHISGPYITAAINRIAQKVR